MRSVSAVFGRHIAGFRIACVCALTQWALALAIQLGDFFGYKLPPGGDWKAGAFFLAMIPTIQAQNALVAAIFGLAAYFAAWNPITAWIFFGIYCAESTYLLIDQVYYKVFLDHIRLGAFESGHQLNLTLLFGSFSRELDWIFYCTAAFALLGAALFARALLSKPSPAAKLRYALAIGAMLGPIGVPAWSSRYYGHVNEHAVVGLARELGQQSLVHSLAGRGDASSHAIESHRSEEPADDDPRLAALPAAGALRNPRPNVVLIVLESVGAVNLLDAEGQPVPAYAPNLALLARDGIVFNSIYTTFPGTTRSLISLHTGGRQPTYGGLADVSHPYQGSVLPRITGDLGYDTAYFSSERMDGEGTSVSLKQMGFRKYYDFSEDAHVHDSRYQIHSWGAREDYTVGLMEDWIAGIHPDGEHPGGKRPGEKPFLLEYMTAATHHPYGAPPGYPLPFPRRDLHSDYLNALHYTDHAIGTIVDFLGRRGLLKDTIIVVTGDHGEAFGDRHANDYVHKDFTYDENVREFLLIYDGRLVSRKPIDKPVTSNRVGSNGDIMPTIAALLGEPVPAVPGRNLLAERFESRPVFFHKLAEPETWGLRDGRWKYIGEIRTSAAELYDLSADPTEKTNLASWQPARAAQYREMCQEWYLKSETEFTARLKGNKMTETVDTRMGARSLAVGYWNQTLICSGKPATGYTCQSAPFVEKAVVDGVGPVVAWTKWALDPDSSAEYEWISPSGKRLVSRPLDSREWHVTRGEFPGKLPMEPGVWSVYLREKSEVHLRTQFTVT